MFQGAFNSPEDEFSGQGKRPVVFDVVAQDRSTSILPDGLKMVLHVNPKTMSFSYSKQIERVATRGGFVEFHWGDAAEQISFDMATGGFMRLYSGLSNVTAPQGRRQTLAYQKYVDFLALFHCNGALYDSRGNIVHQNLIKCSFDGGVYIGWFDGSFTVTETADSPYQFAISTTFIIDKEEMVFRSSVGPSSPGTSTRPTGVGAQKIIGP